MKRLLGLFIILLLLLAMTASALADPIKPPPGGKPIKPTSVETTVEVT